MATEPEPDVLAGAVARSGLAPWELWLRYLGLGGTASPEGLASHIRGTGTVGGHQHDVLVQALDERFVELDLDHPVPDAADAP